MSSWSELRSQLVVDNNVNATDGVQDILLGAGITVSNITFSGTNNQVAGFDCPDCNLGLASGLILCAGNASNAVGPNNSGSTSSSESGFAASDPDLAMAMAGNLNDAAVLEFDFVPTGDSLVFRYVFASEEYSEYLGFGDVFGFFLSGPGISGTFTNGAVNLAQVPGTSLPVSVPNVNNGSTGTNGPCVNCAYFVHNGNGSQSPYNTDDYYVEFDGLTTVLTAYAEVQCGETYHIKLAIADWSDTSWDSAVFLEAGSFQSNQVEVAYQPPSISPDNNSLYEGCDTAVLTFTRPGNTSQEVIYDMILTGAATNGVDYSALPSELIFPIGVSTVQIPVTALEDGLTEGNESITITIEGASVCSNSESTTYTFEIADVIPLSAVMADVVINCDETVTLTPAISGGFGFYTILWDTGDEGASLTIDPDNATTYTYTVLDTCGVNPLNDAVNVSFPAYPAVNVDLGADQQFTCLDDIVVDALVSGGYGAYEYSWELNGTVVSTDPQFVYNTNNEGTITLTVTDICNASDVDAMDYTFPPVAVNVNLGSDLIVTCLDINDIEPIVSGGVGAYSYNWTANGIPAGFDPTYSAQVDEQTTYVLTVEDECGNQNSDELIISVPPVAVDVELGGDLSVTCIDESLLVPDVNGGVGNYTYVWSTQNGVLSVSDQYNLQTDEDVTINLTVTDECNNSAEDFISVVVPQVFVSVDLGQDLTVLCTDLNNFSPDVSGGVGSYDYLWQMNGQNVGVNSTFNTQVDENTQLTLFVEDQCGNVSSDQIFINVPPVPVAVNIGPDIVATCIQTSFIPSTVEGGVGAFTYEWNDGNGVLSVSSNCQYQTSEFSTITLTVTDECGNTNSDILTISVPPVPVNLMLTPDTAICIGQSVNLSAMAQGGVGEISYSWFPYTSVYSEINVAPGETTNYSVVVEDQCGNMAAGAVNVGVEDVTASFNVNYIGDWNVSLQNQSDNAVSYTWIFSDGTITDENSPDHEFNTLDPWQVTLIAEGELGCKQEITEVVYPEANIYIPNTFTPDGDGINEYFRAYGHDLKRFEMWIVNRWGQQVFYSNDIEMPWMGEYSDGTHFVPNGSYQVIIEAEGIRGNLITKTGVVSIMR